jgi:hypothetical protein
VEWTSDAVAAAVEDANTLVRSDGAALVLIGADARAARIELRLDVDDAQCASGACVLPREMLEPLIVAALRRHLPGEFELRLHDSRDA